MSTISRRHLRISLPWLHVAIVATLIGLGAMVYEAHADSAPQCPGNTEGGEEITNELLESMIPYLNSAWPTVVKDLQVDPLEPVYHGDIDISCSAFGDYYCGVYALFEGRPICKKSYLDLNISSLKGLSNLQFKDMSVTSLNGKDISSHSSAGPEAGLITDGIFASEGTDWKNNSQAVVIPTTDTRHGLVIELGRSVEICGNQNTCGPLVQADGNDVYALDYSTDGVNWLQYGQFSKASNGGLRTRRIAQITSGVTNPAFTASFVRIRPLSGDGNYSVSELELFSTQGSLVSGFMPATGPAPFQISDGVTASEGSDWDNEKYAVILKHRAERAALTVDLGSVIEICGDQNSCGPRLQARHDSAYEIAYSVDGKSWTKYGTFPKVADKSGLRTRAMNAILSGATNPNFSARFVRLWANTNTDEDKYSISEIILSKANGTKLSGSFVASGPEPFIINGEFADEGEDWDAGRWATVLATDPSGGSAKVIIDLGSSFAISQMIIQADNDDVYQVDVSPDRATWFPLWTVPTTTQSGLRKRESVKFPDGSVAPMRFVRVYASSGDGKYSVSELQIYTFEALTPCSYKPSANGDLNLSCSYDGSFKASAYVPSGSISATVDQAAFKVKCTNGLDYPFESEKTYTVQKFNSITCQVKQPKGDAKMNFCAGTCAEGMPSSVMTYAETSSVSLVIPEMSCNTGWGDIPSWFFDEVAPSIKSALESTLEPILVGVLDSLLKDYVAMPFPQKCAISSGALQSSTSPSTSTIKQKTRKQKRKELQRKRKKKLSRRRR